MSARLRNEGGASLVELLAAMSVGMIVLFAVLSFQVTATRGALEVGDRAEAAQRARLVLDQMTTTLQGQVCIDAARPPIVAADGSTLTFYADLGDESFRPRQHRYTYDATARTITESTWTGTGVAPAITFAALPTTTRIIARNVTTSPGIPMFRYYAFSTTSPISASVLLPVPLSAFNARRVVRVSIRFVAQPERTRTSDRRAATIEGDAFVGSLEATVDPQHGPRCS